MSFSNIKTLLSAFLLSILLITTSANPSTINDPLTVPEFLQTISVIVDTPVSAGSGIAFSRKDSTGTNIVTFVWTAGHIITHQVPLMQARKQYQTFSENTLTNFYNPNRVILRQDIIVNGEKIGETNVVADVIKISGDDGDDLALLKVRGNFFVENTVTFDLCGKAPRIGTKMYSMSAPREEWGTFSEGTISRIGVLIGGRVFDQTSCNTIYEGSSGGGAFTTDGKCIGLFLVMQFPAINFIIPVRRMQQWAKDEHIEWAMDPTVPIPTDSEMSKIPREDTVKHKISPISDLIIFPDIIIPPKR